MLRRAALTSAQRLNVLASIQNNLHSADVERGLRAVEEELTHPDQSGGRKGKGGGKGRSFWVEEDGEWGIFMGTEMEVEEFVDLSQVHWVNKSPMQDYPTKTQEHNLESVMEDGFWNQEEDGGYSWWDSGGDGEYYHQDISGTYWAWSDWETQQQTSLMVAPEQLKEVQEAYAAYEQKARTFQEARRVMAAKGANRGFYPSKGGGKRSKKKGSSKERKERGNLRFCQWKPPLPFLLDLSLRCSNRVSRVTPGASFAVPNSMTFEEKAKGGSHLGATSWKATWASSCGKRSRSSWRREAMETSGSTRT